jgi:16S rRNA (guanine527-N7)-methyltransferase
MTLADPLRPALDAGLAQLGLVLAPQQRDSLLRYLSLIAKWNQVYNLTAVREPAQMLTQHLLDCLAAVTPLQQHLAPLGGAVRLLDVGAGAGLPGAVFAQMLGDRVSVTCVDAVAKKAAFVAQVAAELGLKNLLGLHARVESLPGPYEVIVCRAFATLADFVRGSQRALAPGGVWLAMKGRRPEEEIAALPRAVEVFAVEPLKVPGLDAQRCLVWMRPRAAA